MDKLPQPDSLILVTYLPSPYDLEVARVLGWYRIPLRTAPKVISIDYLAFYQPSSFGDTKWRIEKIAGVRGHELVTRSELIRDEPNHPKANEEYFKIQLGSILDLPKPILAKKWKRITFFYTTGHYLMAAETINDLIIHSEERKLLWKSLRDRSEQRQGYEIPDVDIPPAVIKSLLGISEIEENLKEIKNDASPPYT